LQQNHQAELMRFRNHCAVQQELLHALINKALFTLLLEQQTQLAQIGFPKFSLAFVESLKQYIDGRKKSANSINKNNLARHAGWQEFDNNLASHIRDQGILLCAFLSCRLHVVNKERSQYKTLAKRYQLYLQQHPEEARRQQQGVSSNNSMEQQVHDGARSLTSEGNEMEVTSFGGDNSNCPEEASGDGGLNDSFDSVDGGAGGGLEGNNDSPGAGGVKRIKRRRLIEVPQLQGIGGGGGGDSSPSYGHSNVSGYSDTYSNSTSPR